MPLDPRVQRFLRILEATTPPDPSRLTTAQRRDGFRDLMQFADDPAPVAGVADSTIHGPNGPIPIRVYTPLDPPAGKLPGLIYFHGGGLVAGSLDTHDPLCRVLANETVCRLIAVDYRLAPEQKFPAAVTDGVAATDWAFDNAAALHIDPTRIGIGGDSAGATLAAIVCQMRRESVEKNLAWQLLICPIMDYATETGSRRTAAPNRLLNPAMLGHDLSLYLPSGVSPADPRISPLRADDISNLPPAFIHTAEFDPLRDEGKRYADRLTDSGVAVNYTCHPGMVHLFYALSRVVPYATTALKQIGGDIRNQFGPPH